MGQPITREHFKPEDYKKFKQRLYQQLEVLEEVLSDKNFSQQTPKIGAEVEYSIVDKQFKPAFVNKEIAQDLNDSNCQFELNQFNLEYNFNPIVFEGKPFEQLEKDMLSVQQKLSHVCAAKEYQLVTIGILPTLQAHHLEEKYMTDEPRYRALARGIKALRQAPFKIDIAGEEPIHLHTPDLTFEGANTSLQVHLQIKPQEFARWYNAIQLATPIAVAVGCNSPIFLHQLLWHESRIAVFKQSVDSRKDERSHDWRQPNRVTFGYGWVRKSAHEYFSELVSLYEPLIPVCPKPKQSDPPDLFELRMHQGTVWKWNRAIYDPKGQGHLRIEMRCFPSGPSVKDMVANSAFLIGLASSLYDSIDPLISAFPFMFAEYNFYRASQYGLEANLLWPTLNKTSPEEVSVVELAQHYLPRAHEGLVRMNIDAAEAKQWLGHIEQRLKTNQTGAAWQRQAIAQLDNQFDRQKACQKMLEIYIKNMSENRPVGTWTKDSL